MASVPAVIRSLEDTALTLLGRSSAADAETARGLLETALRYRGVREDMRRGREPEEAEEDAAPAEDPTPLPLIPAAPAVPSSDLQEAILLRLAREPGDGWVAWPDLQAWGRNPIAALRALERRGLVEGDRSGDAPRWRLTADPGKVVDHG